MVEERSENQEKSQICINQTPKKRKNDLSVLTNCYSCNFYSPLSPQTLTSLKTLVSEWRIILLCDTCLNLINSSVKCAFCFSNFANCEKDQLLDCVKCSRRIHLNCILREQRFVSLACLKRESFVCIDCCAVPRGRSEIYKSQNFNNENDCGNARDEELALKLHLAMNGSRRTSRRGPKFFGKMKSNEICRKNKKEIDLCSSSSNGSIKLAFAVKGEESCSDKVVNCSNKGKFDGCITYQRASKSKGAGLPKNSSENEHRVNEENICSLGEISRPDVHDRFAKKYFRRKFKGTHVGS